MRVKSILVLALLFSFPTFGREKHHDVKKPQSYTMFSFNRPSSDCFMVEPPRRSKGVAKWECASKPVGKEK